MIETGTLLGLLIGTAGTAAGGTIALLLRKKETLSRPLMAFAGGLMVAVVFFDMLTEAAHLGGIFLMCGGTAAGGIFLALLSWPLHQQKQKSIEATGWMVLIGIALHNFPEGLAVGAALMENERFALLLALLMLVHNIPEGMAFCLPLHVSGMPAPKILGLAALTGLPTAFGAAVGSLVGSISPDMIAFCIAFAGGAMLYISLGELIPAAKRTHQKSAVPAALGLSIGFCLATAISL